MSNANAVVERDLVWERKFKRNRILRTLGTYGWESISRMIFASCLTGSPVMVYGSHGAGKTMTFRRLAQKCFAQPFALYDASKANLVDIIGYPNVEKFKQGKMEFVHTPLSIWGKKVIVLDETTRAREDNQNWYLEILRNGTLQGVDTGVRWKFLAANTLDYSGTRPLDEAFASRVAYYVPVPEFLRMEKDDQLAVANSREGADSPALRIWDENRANPDDLVPDMSVEFGEYMRDLTQLYAQVEENYREMFIEYVIQFSTLLETRTNAKKNDKKNSEIIQLDARTNVTLITNMLANVTLDLWEYQELGADFTNAHLREVVLDTVLHSFPWVLTGQKVSTAAINEAHQQSYSILITQDLVAYTIATEKNLIRRALLALFMEDEDPIALYDAVELLLDQPRSIETTLFTMFVSKDKKILGMLDSKPDMQKRIDEIKSEIWSRAVEAKVPSGDYKKFLVEEFGEDPDSEDFKDQNLRYAMLYMNYIKEGDKLFKMEQVSYETEIKEAYKVACSVDDLMREDYNTTREKLISKRLIKSNG